MPAEKERYDVKTDKNVRTTMRDGTILRADVYRPRADGQFSVLLRRMHYDKRRPECIHQASVLAARGYVVVVQDVRGRYSSGGKYISEFGGITCEAEDGYDSVEWAATLPYSNGRVGTYSYSYCALLQWRLATLRPPHLVAMAPIGIPARILDLTFGVFETGRRLDFLYAMAGDCRRRDGITTGPQTYEEAVEAWHMERHKWIWWLPLDELPAEEIFYGLADQYHAYLRHQNVEYWGFHERHSQINVPAFGITGWYDRCIGTIDHFTGMRQNGMTEHARRNQKLLIGPWGHTDNLKRSNVGVMDFGTEAQLDYIDELSQWFDYWLKGVDNGIMDEPPIKLFVMGENKWRYENEWPLARTVYTDYYLHSSGAANTPRGDGSLSPTPPGDESVDVYVYNPKDPVMSLCTPGVPGWSAPFHDAAYDQRPLDHRRDVLVFVTEPLEEDVEVTGPVVVKLWAASTAPDTDFTAKLVDVYPDGFAVNLCHGIVRARYRDSFENPSLIKPGQIYEYTIPLRPTGNLFKKGHRIRVDISSSNFPFFDRNHNTGREFYEDAELVAATQTVYHNGQYPSRIILPVIPR